MSDSQEPLLFTVPEAASILRISRNSAYELLRQNILPHIRLGRRILVPRHALEQWIERQASIASSPPEMVLSLKTQK